MLETANIIKCNKSGFGGETFSVNLYADNNIIRGQMSPLKREDVEIQHKLSKIQKVLLQVNYETLSLEC